MNKLALLLILISAVIHPTWNMLLKRSEDKVVFYFNIHLFFTVLFGFIPFIYSIADITTAGWIFIILSSITHFLYQVYLCRTYELGDLSLTYPIVRSAPLFVVIMGIVFLGEKISLIAIFGILLTVFGAQLINQKNFSLRQFHHIWKGPHRKAFIAAAFTAFFSALYSVVDKKGVLNIEPVLFFYIFFALSGLMFGVYLLFFEEKKKIYWAFTKRNALNITAAAVLEFSSYILILYAFRLANVATVVAIRQVSVVFGALLGVLVLKEEYGRIRFLASIIIFAGVYILVAFK